MNKIDYIVQGNPEGVQQLIHNYGYEFPKGEKELIQATKELIRLEGKNIIRDLVQLHPDRAAILATQPQPVYDNFCGACQSYSYVPEANSCGTCGHSYYEPTQSQKQYLAQFEEMTTDSIRAYYNDLVDRSRQFPGDTNLALEVELVFNLLRDREKMNENTSIADPQGSAKDFKKKVVTSELLAAGGILLVGVLIGLAFSTPNKKTPCPCSQ